MPMTVQNHQFIIHTFSYIPNTVQKQLTVWLFLKNLNTELLHDPEIPLLGIHHKKLHSWSFQTENGLGFSAALGVSAGNGAPKKV